MWCSLTDEITKGLTKKMTIQPVSSEQTLDSLVADALAAEGKAILQIANGDKAEILKAIRLIHASTGQLIVAGVGKSGHIARKIAATFNSVGKPAVFLHASEASHGDLGLVQSDSVVLILSNSGETAELSDVIHYCTAHSIPIVSITSKLTSSLARASYISIAYGEIREVCPNGLAPTTSTTLSLAIGDALAVGVTQLLGTAPEDFRRYHPAGSLGAQLMKAGALARPPETLPLVSNETSMAETVAIMSEKSLGVAIVLSEDGIEGIITDGDLRRHSMDLWMRTAGEIATRNPIFIEDSLALNEAVEVMTKMAITSCLVRSSNGEFVGLLHMHDCLQKGVGI